MGMMDKLKNPSVDQLVKEKVAAQSGGTYDEEAQKKAMAAAVLAGPQTAVAVSNSKPLPAAQQVAPVKPQDDPVYSLVTQGDLSRLSNEQRLSYYHEVCRRVGLNPLTKPFDFIKLNGKLVLYANKDATAQLAAVNTVSVTIVDKVVDKASGVLLVFARASTPDGRQTDQVGGVALFEKMKGEDVANAWMKCITKANRRAVLTHCGLGMLDESEFDTIPAKNVERLTVAEPTPLKAPEAPRKLEPAPAVSAAPSKEVVDGSVDDEAEGGAKPAGDFDFSGVADRQWLIKEIRNRFPQITKENLKHLAETYQNEHSREFIAMALNEAHKASKGIK